MCLQHAASCTRKISKGLPSPNIRVRVSTFRLENMLHESPALHAHAARPYVRLTTVLPATRPPLTELQSPRIPYESSVWGCRVDADAAAVRALLLVVCQIGASAILRLALNRRQTKEFTRSPSQWCRECWGALSAVAVVFVVCPVSWIPTQNVSASGFFSSTEFLIWRST